ncbi:MAG: hypothetical protein GY830_01435 [Bacteroidetes bacterium]|nr:hypothetical protein [Bacteroidota bacterium]
MYGNVHKNTNSLVENGGSATSGKPVFCMPGYIGIAQIPQSASEASGWMLGLPLHLVEAISGYFTVYKTTISLLIVVLYQWNSW